MGQFVVKSETRNVNYEYTNSTLFVSGTYAKNGQTNTLNNINGQCYRLNAQGVQGDYVGQFTGHMNGDTVKYDLSEMTRQDSNAVWDAIDEIEPYVLGTNSEE